MTAELQSTSHGQTLVLTLRAPEARNALDGAICAAGIEALGVAERSDEVRSVVITGADGFFSAETSLERLQARRQQPAQAQAQGVELLHHWVEAVRTHPKPVIAAVEGMAEGAGFSLALACDLVVAARNAAFAMGGARLGLSPAGGASWNLPRSLPHQMASEILLCGEHIAAPRLHALGLVNHLAEPGRALHEALALAQRLNARAPNALASIKELVGDAPQRSFTEQLAHERDHLVRSLQHANAGEGIAAALEKRTPNYK